MVPNSALPALGSSHWGVRRPYRARKARAQARRPQQSLFRQRTRSSSTSQVSASQRVAAGAARAAGHAHVGQRWRPSARGRPSGCGLQNEDLVELNYRGRKVQAPVWMVPGHADADRSRCTSALGRTNAGRVRQRRRGLQCLCAAHLRRAASSAQVSRSAKTGSKHPLAATQSAHPDGGAGDRHLSRRDR